MPEGALPADPADRAAGGGVSRLSAGVPGAAQSPRQGGGSRPDHQAKPGAGHEVHHADVQEGRLRTGPG